MLNKIVSKRFNSLIIITTHALKTTAPQKH